MTKKRFAVEFGMGTDLRGHDYTKAAVRALKDALWHNSLNMAQAFDFPPDAMIVDVQIGVAKPELVDLDEVGAVLPYGTANVTAIAGGLDIVGPDGESRTVVANAAAVVYFDVEDVA